MVAPILTLDCQNGFTWTFFSLSFCLLSDKTSSVFILIYSHSHTQTASLSHPLFSTPSLSLSLLFSKSNIILSLVSPWLISNMIGATFRIENKNSNAMVFIGFNILFDTNNSKTWWRRRRRRTSLKFLWGKNKNSDKKVLFISAHLLSEAEANDK